MNVLVDTSIWSLALRRRQPSDDDPFVAEFKELLGELQVAIIGPIRQEILSGIKEQPQFEKLRERLQAFTDLPLLQADYERAAEFFNRCRSQGVQGSNTDFLICAVAERYDLAIFTTDNDFLHFAQHIPISLYTPSRS
ncbi:MAG: PIN domain nuclease [Anaerolineaceae bacterium]|nr:PIN domain nuclease [Anaerolineaceae bacterium]